MENDNVLIYNNLPENDRVLNLTKYFKSQFGKEPDFYVRVPGRVNLIGEHIDYCGYGVCPMALEQDIMLAVAVGDDQNIYLRNMDNSFKSFEGCLKNFSISVGDGSPSWHQYYLCGIRGIFDVLPKEVPIKGMQVIVNGIVPQSAGLSSSSALVSAAALATAHAHNFQLSKKKISDLCAACERYIGTQGGGMDQAIAFLATEGCAKFIEFSPLRSTDIILPSGAVFVIAHSLAELNKAATSDFNCRVVECRLAAQIIAKKHGLEWTNIKRLGELQNSLAVNLPDMISIVEKTLHQEPYTKEEIVRELETTSDHLDSTSLTQNTKHVQQFKLKQRALHVFKEALRVEQFREACSENSLETLGQLMNESHESLRDLYECSHPQLDRLVKLSEGLALGARLTGAGWGGCAVALVRPEDVDKYIKMLTETFYKEHELIQNTKPILFATSPKAGACIYINEKVGSTL